MSVSAVGSTSTSGAGGPGASPPMPALHGQELVEDLQAALDSARTIKGVLDAVLGLQGGLGLQPKVRAVSFFCQ